MLEITTSARERDRRHPLLGCDLGGAYDRFRAVHDIVGHVGPCLGFDRDGEFAAWLTQEQLYDGLARWALATELHAEHSVRWTTATLSDHKAALIDRDLLNRVRNAPTTATAVVVVGAENSAGTGGNVPGITGEPGDGGDPGSGPERRVSRHPSTGSTAIGALRS